MYFVESSSQNTAIDVNWWDANGLEDLKNVARMETGTLFAIAALAGVVAHQAFFKLVEVDTHPLLIANAFLAAPYAVKYVLNGYVQQCPGLTIGTSFLLVGCSILSLWITMLIYRAFFHPLQKFPGPFTAKLSKFWALSQTAKSGLKWYQVDEALHKQFGDYVRTGKSDVHPSSESTKLIRYVGPRELSITDPDALPIILGFSSKTFKGPFYASMEESVSTTRDKVFHKWRRQIWDSSMKSCEYLNPSSNLT